MKKVLRAFLLVLVGVVLFGNGVVHAAIGDPDYVTINDIFVFRNLLETGDQLYFVRYDVSYNTTPTEDADETWQMVLYDTDGTTQVASRPLNYYQHNIISVYLSSTDALTWEGAYAVRVMGMPSVFDALIEGTNMRTRTLGPGDYKEGTEIGAVMLEQAAILEDDWVITLLTAGGLLNATGANYFTIAVGQLGTVAPEIFETVTKQHTDPYTDWDEAYSEALPEHRGSRLQNAMTGIGSIFGINEGWSTFWLVGVMYLLVAGIMYVPTRNPGLAVLAAFPVLVGVAWLGMGTDMLRLVGILVLIAAVLFGIYFILAKFA